MEIVYWDGLNIASAWKEIGNKKGSNLKVVASLLRGRVPKKRWNENVNPGMRSLKTGRNLTQDESSGVKLSLQEGIVNPVQPT